MKKKDQNLPNKNIHSNNTSGKPFLTAFLVIGNNHLFKIIFAEEQQTEKNLQNYSQKR